MLTQNDSAVFHPGLFFPEGQLLFLFLGHKQGTFAEALLLTRPPLRHFQVSSANAEWKELPHRQPGL